MIDVSSTGVFTRPITYQDFLDSLKKVPIKYQFIKAKEKSIIEFFKILRDVGIIREKEKTTDPMIESILTMKRNDQYFGENMNSLFRLYQLSINNPELFSECTSNLTEYDIYYGNLSEITPLIMAQHFQHCVESIRLSLLVIINFQEIGISNYEDMGLKTLISELRERFRSDRSTHSSLMTNSFLTFITDTKRNEIAHSAYYCKDGVFHFFTNYNKEPYKLKFDTFVKKYWQIVTLSNALFLLYQDIIIMDRYPHK